jgi:hypothetical protein
MQKLYLHIGAEKTGSTSIQNFLATNSSVLSEKHGIFYPRHPKLFSHINHSPLAASLLYDVNVSFLSGHKRASPIELSQALSEVCASTPSDTVVLSSEYLSSRFNKGNITVLSGILKLFDVTVVVYLRRQDEMALSTFSTSTRSGSRHWLTEKQVQVKEYRYNFRELVDLWAEKFGTDRIIVRVYEKDKLNRGDAIHDFMSVLGIENLSGLSGVDRKNESLNVKQIKFFLALNQKLPTWKEAFEEKRVDDFKKAKLFRRSIIKIISELDSFSISAKIGSILSAQDRKIILSRFDTDNNYVAKKYLGKKRLFGKYSAEINEPNLIKQGGESKITIEDMFDILTSPLLYGQQHDSCRKQLGQARKQLDQLKSSTSWRITQPLRILARFVRNTAKKIMLRQ